MSEAEQKPESEHVGATVTKEFTVGQQQIKTQVIADWLDIFEKNEAQAKVFFTAYLAQEADSKRPVVFCMNGGPGSASVFLHFASIGPVGIGRTSEGKWDVDSRDILDNPESWLAFADLVFIDPVGTGFSHIIKPKTDIDDQKKASAKDKEDEKNPYWSIKKDLETIGQFMRRFLRQQKLWSRPLYYAGESYGGYRACRLAKLLNREYGLGMSGIISISPIWQFRDASGSDYSTSQWVNLLPTYAAAAHRYGLGRHFEAETPMKTVLDQAEKFAVGDYAQMLLAGNMLNPEQRGKTVEITADMLGLEVDFVSRSNGRISLSDYSRLLKKADHHVTDIYDGSQYSLDPFPHRTNNEEAIEESMFSDFHRFHNIVHRWFFEEMGIKTDLEYNILNMEACKTWKDDERKWDLYELSSAADDFRAGMTAYHHQRALIVHGKFDTVTPYFASKRILQQINFNESVRSRITEILYDGGHMFYSWPEVNKQFRDDAREFVGGQVAQT